VGLSIPPRHHRLAGRDLSQPFISRLGPLVVAVLGATCANLVFVRPIEDRLPPVRAQRLANGLQLLTEVDGDPLAPLVSVVAVVEGGSSQDPPGKEGLAHLVEHLAYRAPDAGGVSRRVRLQRLGVEANAFVDADSTVYHATMTRRTLESFLPLAIEQLTEPLANLDESNFVAEKAVVISEMRRIAHGDVSPPGLRALLPLLFPERNAATSEAVAARLESLTLNDARSFAQSRYRPSRMTVFVAGGLSLSHATVAARLQAAMVTRPFSADAELPSFPDARRAPVLASRSHVKAPVATPEVWIGWRLPSGYRKGAALRMVTAQLIRAQLSSDSFRDESREIGGVGTQWEPGSAADVLVVRASVEKSTDLGTAAAAMMNRIQTIWASDLADPALVGRTASDLSLSLSLGYDDVSTRAVQVARWATRANSPGAYTEILRGIPRVSAFDLKEFVDKYLVPERAKVIFVDPADLAPTDVARDRTAALPAMEASRGSADEIDATAADIGTIATRRLENQLMTIAVQRPGTLTAALALGFGGGTGSTFGRAAPEAAFAAGQWKVAVPGVLGPWSQLDRNGFVSQVLTYGDNVSPGAECLQRSSIIRYGSTFYSFGMEWPSERFIRRLPYLRQYERQPRARAEAGLWLGLFGAHPLGQTACPDEVAKVTRSEVMAWLASERQPANGVLTVVSSEPTAKTLDRIESVFGGWHADGKSPVPRAPAPPALNDRNSRWSKLARGVFDRPGAVQVNLLFGCRLPGGTERQMAATELFAHLLQTRLFDGLREKRGASYSVATTVVSLGREARVLRVAADIGEASFAEVARQFRTIFDDAADDGFAHEEVEFERVNVIRQSRLGAAKVGGLATNLTQLSLAGFPPEVLSRAPLHLAVVTAAELQDLAGSCRANAAVMFVGAQASIEGVCRTVWPEAATHVPARSCGPD
jgi:zinc protease